ncbi:MAG: hypothetical protein NT084_00480 [Bacteroidetes bacterium]|nr:hypothetical protein [Bacteroidota bacterium]
MKNILLSISVSFILIALPAQVESGDLRADDKKSVTPTAEETHAYFAAGCSYYFLPLASVNAQLESMGLKKGFTSAIGLGLDRGYASVTSKLTHAVTGLMSFHYLLPQESGSAGDSIKATLNGYNAQFDLLGANFLKSQTVTFTGGLGWAFGRLKLTENKNGAKTTFLDKYFAPELRVEFNVRLADHFFIGLRYAYRYDVTKKSWSVSGANPTNLAATDMSGTMIGAFIGYGK